MSSSRSDGVTQFVCVSVPKEFLLNLERICSVIGSELVLGLFYRISLFQSMLQVIFVSRKFQGCFKEVSRVFQESFKGVSRKFQGCFKKV